MSTETSSSTRGIDSRRWLEVRRDPRRWFEGFGRHRDEQTRRPVRGCANVLQRRIFEHYRRCQAERRPCRMVVLKYRRAGASTAGSCLTYLHAMNYRARLGVIGTDYKASSNMLDMVRCYGEHDDFPGWSVYTGTGEGPLETSLEIVPWEERIDRVISTKLVFAHDSVVELYTSLNPESARSAGLSGYHATECGRWQAGGAHDGGETLTAMRNALPKRGFHFALEESTANGAQGAFYQTCRTARWPDYANWARQWDAQWPLTEAEFGRDLQFTLIFAAWFEDERHVPNEPLTPSQEERIRATLTEDERALLARFGQDGPRGLRLGGEVQATAWEQLAWRRSIIATVCTKRGAEEFKQEYPSTPAEAFRASGSAALDQEGLIALESMAHEVNAAPECGRIESGEWAVMPMNQAEWLRWEAPFAGGRYLVICDPMSGAEAVHGTGEKDRHAVFVLRDAYTDAAESYHRLKVVARLKPPCQWEDELIAAALDAVSRYYGGATIVVEGNVGAAILKSLHTEYNAPLFLREEIDKTTQAVTRKLGWWTDAASRRVAISALQVAVREQTIEIPCPHAVGELSGLVIDQRGKAVAGGSGHDDDAMALAIGLATMHCAVRYTPVEVKPPTRAADEDRWKEW